MVVDIQKLHEKFFSDPDWAMMEELIREYIEPLRSVGTIDSKMGNDQIATEVRGRQIAYDSLDRFLNDSKIISRKLTTQTTFK